MDSAFKQYGFFTLVLLIGIVGLLAAIWRSKSISRTPGSKRAPIDYLLLWPLLFGNDSTNDGRNYKGTGISKRVVFGWLFVAVLAGLAIFFHW
jgi:hypothetical protein